MTVTWDDLRPAPRQAAMSAQFLTPFMLPRTTNLMLSLLMIQFGEGERGYLLDLLLTKLRYATVSPHPHATH